MSEPSLNHIELFVGDLDAGVAAFTDSFGFRPVATAGGPEHRSVAVAHGSIVLVLTQGSGGHRAAAFVARHGDGVADIALRSTDIAADVERAVAGGAHLHRQATTMDHAYRFAQISGFGDVRHTIVQHGDDHPYGLSPLFRPVRDPGPAGDLLTAVDHVAVCVPAGGLPAVTGYYERALGLRRVFQERIQVGEQAMDSTVVRGGDLTLTLIEPDTTARPGQIDDFLTAHDGAGVQHIAFTAPDVVRSVDALTARGVRFLDTPDSYYDMLAERVVPESHSVADLRARRILADQDHGGQLFQVFTRSTHSRGTLFYEIIQRDGAETFGAGNIKALYAAVEFDRALS